MASGLKAAGNGAESVHYCPKSAIAVVVAWPSMLASLQLFALAELQDQAAASYNLSTSLKFCLCLCGFTRGRLHLALLRIPALSLQPVAIHENVAHPARRSPPRWCLCKLDWAPGARSHFTLIQILPAPRQAAAQLCF